MTSAVTLLLVIYKYVHIIWTNPWLLKVDEDFLCLQSKQCHVNYITRCALYLNKILSHSENAHLHVVYFDDVIV